MSSPSVHKKRAIDSAQTIEKLKKETYQKNRKIKQQYEKSIELKQNLQMALNKHEFDEETKEKLQKLTQGNKLSNQLNNLLLNKTKSYPPQIRKFCLSLHFYSPKVIQYI